MEIINIEYLKNNVVNEELFDLCSKDEEKIKRYLNIVTNKIKIYLDIEQFKNKDGKYIFPEDLQDTCRFLVESLYLNRHLNATYGKLTSYTDKHDDYSEAKTFAKTGDFENLLWYDIPIIREYLDILNRYRGESVIRASGRFKI